MTFTVASRAKLLLAVSALLCGTILIGGQYDFKIETLEETSRTKHNAEEKEWTILIEIAADNDLRGFAARNIKQMAAIGSNHLVNIIVELHIRLSANKKITRRYFIEQGKIIHMNADDPTTQRMDSGDQQTFISFCSWALNNYPSKHVAVFFWDHATGIIDPGKGKIAHPTELFSFNPKTNKLELDRSIGFLDFINLYAQNQRGLCWDDSTGNYLTNQKLAYALKFACKEYNNGKKFDIVGFDACLMSMVEIGDLIKDYANFMVASQEVELATGWNWELILSKFTQESPEPLHFAQHIVAMYEKTYNKITTDYTLSAVNLQRIDQLSENVDEVAHLLLEGLKSKNAQIIRAVIKASRDKTHCTHFDEPSYIDLHHFYKNLETNIDKIRSTDNELTSILESLKTAATEGKAIIESLVVANITSKNLSQAKGLSIYFPERKIHFSYEKAPFIEHNSWGKLLNCYIPAQ